MNDQRYRVGLFLCCSSVFSLCILLFSLTACTSSGMYPANLRISGLPAAYVTAEVVNCYQSEDTLYILINDGHREKLVSVFPWDPTIQIREVNRFSASTFGWDNGHSTVIELFYQTSNSRKKVLTIGKNVRINTPVWGDIKLQIGPPAQSNTSWLHARLVGGLSGINETVAAGEAAVLNIDGDAWKFILFGASLPADREDALLNPAVYFTASFVLYLPG